MKPSICKACAWLLAGALLFTGVPVAGDMLTSETEAPLSDDAEDTSLGLDTAEGTLLADDAADDGAGTHGSADTAGTDDEAGGAFTSDDAETAADTQKAVSAGSAVSALLSDWSPDRYTAYIRPYEDQPRPTASVALSPQSAAVTGGIAPGSALTITDKGTARWIFSVAQAGLYELQFTYRYTDTSQTANAAAGVELNGFYPFGETGSTVFRRLWRDQDTERSRDSRGNDLKSSQVQLTESVTADVPDVSGRTRSCLFYLQAGENTLTLSFNGIPLQLEGVTFKNESVPSYAEYLDGRTPSALPAPHLAYIQAEELIAKNDSVLTAARDRTGPATMPSDPVKLRLNVLDGTAFKTAGQKAVFSFSVPEDGFYSIGIRARQSASEGVRVFRRMTVDGELPFAEAADWGFSYRTDWEYTVLGGDTPYYIYLKAGTHTLEWEAVTGDNGELVYRLQSLIYVLNRMYRRIVMITGVSPDSLRDYSLDKDIPELIPTFQELADTLSALSADAQRITGSKGGQISVLTQLETQLREFIDDPAAIPARLASYASNVSAVSSLMTLLQSQPLSVDYFTIVGCGTPQPETEADFFSALAYHVQAFLATFFNDYVVLDDEAGTAEREINAWFSGGREQAELLKQIIDSEFTPKSGIRVKLELVQVSLTQSYLAGKAPDVVMTVNRGTPVNLAARGVLEELSAFDGYEEVAGWFPQTALLPYTYRGGCYALPTSLSFHMLFTRNDVLEELGLSAPQTWDQLYDMLPVLQRNHMTVGLPYTTMSSSGTIENGLGAKDIFPALLMQKGGNIYNRDLTALALDTPAALRAFKEWTELYTQFGLDMSYDFYNRFRTGEMPVGITAYSMYNQLTASAPEIAGLWDFYPIPGTLRKDGSIDRTEAASGGGAVMVRGADKDAAWTFLYWWVGADAQYRYATETELLMGPASRAAPANCEALQRLPWDSSQLSALTEQLQWLSEIPEVVGGYYTARGIDNAFRNVIFNADNYREALMEQVSSVNNELIRKQREFAAS